MKILNIPFTVTEWSSVKPVEHPGEGGTSHWRIFEAGNIRARIVEYSPGYRSDHWCPKGHIFLVLEGEFDITLRDGRSFQLRPGMSFQAGDDEANPHLGHSPRGAKAFIVD
jgi:quercetin dioxygenase-like cupin family protein